MKYSATIPQIIRHGEQMPVEQVLVPQLVGCRLLADDTVIDVASFMALNVFCDDMISSRKQIGHLRRRLECCGVAPCDRQSCRNPGTQAPVHVGHVEASPLQNARRDGGTSTRLTLGDNRPQSINSIDLPH